MSTYKELLQAAVIRLKQQKIEDAEIDAWYLLEHVFHMKRMDYFLQQDSSVPENEKLHYEELIIQRASHIPLQHLIGNQEFMGLEFEVSKDVLIPRQDTEILVEEVLKICEHKEVLDMCTGSGCIIISLAKLSSLKKAVGVDVSDQALLIAAKNARKHIVNIEFIQSNLFEKVEGSYDIIVSNPPYIPTGDIEGLMPEVKDHEPLLALDGDLDGLVFYRNIAMESKRFLKPKGYLFFEIGHDQGKAVEHILYTQGYENIKVIKDLSGHDRVVSASIS
ncbi:MAG: peptide chain release factor N(5)-glutamine methyltransferase [Mobilitalea sp.]